MLLSLKLYLLKLSVIIRFNCYYFLHKLFIHYLDVIVILYFNDSIVLNYFLFWYVMMYPWEDQFACYELSLEQVEQFYNYYMILWIISSYYVSIYIYIYIYLTRSAVKANSFVLAFVLAVKANSRFALT